MAEPTSTSDWCQTLGLALPKLEAIADHREANAFALLLVALLERGGPVGLAERASTGSIDRAANSTSGCSDSGCAHRGPHGHHVRCHFETRTRLHVPVVARLLVRRVDDGAFSQRDRATGCGVRTDFAGHTARLVAEGISRARWFPSRSGNTMSGVSAGRVQTSGGGLRSATVSHALGWVATPNTRRCS